MILEHIKFQALQCSLCGHSFCKWHFQDHLDPGPVALFYHVFELTDRRISRSICFFRRKIMSRTVSPVIDLCLPAFFKFIDRHTLDLIDAELLQVREFLNDPKISPFMSHF